MKRMEHLISAYEEAQRRCRNLRIEPDRMTRKNDILRILYEAYSECSPMDDAQIKVDFNALYQAMNGMELREMDRIIYPVCTLCRDHERAGFIEGVKIGLRLERELATDLPP